MTDKVAFFLDALYGGGTERVMLNLAAGLSERKLAVDLVLGRAEGAFLREVPTSVRVVDLVAGRALASLPGLIRYLRRERPRALLSAGAHRNVVALWARRIAQVPSRVVATEHTFSPRFSLTAQGCKAAVMRQCMRRFYREAHAVVAVSHGLADHLAETTGMSRRHIAVIYNPIVHPRLLERARAPLDHPWFRPMELPVILGVGRLEPNKNFAGLVRAFALVSRERPARLLILGEGSERPRLEALSRTLGVERDISLPGFVENPFAYMYRASGLVLCSQAEALPTVLVEAMACGCPVVSTNSPGGGAEILGGGRYGALIALSDGRALARAIIEMLDRPRPADELRRRAGEFSVEAASAQYLDVLAGTSSVGVNHTRVVPKAST